MNNRTVLLHKLKHPVIIFILEEDCLNWQPKLIWIEKDQRIEKTFAHTVLVVISI